MKKNQSIVNDFLNSLKGKIIGAVCGVLCVFLIAKWDYVVKTFNYGKETKADIEFNNKLDSALTLKIQSKDFMSKVMTSPFMIDYKRDQHNEFINESLRKDSSKVKMSAYLSLKTGMTNEAVMDSLVSLLNRMKKGRFINNDRCLQNISNNSRGIHRLTGM